MTARTVAAEPEVSTVILADIDERRTKEIAKKLPAGKATPLTLDVSDRDALLRTLHGVDFVINGLIPDFNMELMHACLETGTHYRDMAAAGPRDVVGSADLDEEFALDAEFKKRGLTAPICFGVDPGASVMGGGRSAPRSTEPGPS